MRREGSSQKAQAIDLAIVATSSVDLFEVKTSSRTTGVYTDVGQLPIHGECIEELLGPTVKRHLVLPQARRPSRRKAFSRKPGTRVAAYEKQEPGYQFKGWRRAESRFALPHRAAPVTYESREPMSALCFHG